MNESTPVDPWARAARRWFWFGCAFELALGLVALLIARGLNISLGGWPDRLGRDVLLGVTAALPLLGMFYLMLMTPWKPLRQIRGFLETVFVPMARHWSVPHIALLALLAGVAEETLFRAVVQGGLTPRLGPTAALVVASLLFGLVHCITAGYVALATLMGLYLGWLWQFSGHLLAPVITHALYDFAAILWLLHGARRASP